MAGLGVVGKTLTSGLVTTKTLNAALAALAIAEGNGMAQPINATSHMLFGDEAANLRRADVDHTIIGLGTHTAATIFWASAFEASLVLSPARDPLSIAGRAASIGLLAAIVDYTITPGWELVLSKKAMTVVYGATAADFVGVAPHEVISHFDEAKHVAFNAPPVVASVP